MRARPIAHRVRRRMLLLIVLMALALGGAWIVQTLLHGREAQREEARQYIESRRESLQDRVRQAVTHISIRRSQNENNVRQRLRDRVEHALSLAQAIHRRHRDDWSAEQIQREVLDTLRSMRFDGGRGFFFVLDPNGLVLLRPDRPQVEGGPLPAGRGADAGGGLSVAMREVLEKQPIGFFNYRDPFTIEEDAFVEKLSCLAVWEPYRWVIGTGTCVRDVERSLKTEIADWLHEVRLTDDRYMFAATFDGQVKAGPGRGRNMWDVTDAHGDYTVRDLVGLARAGGGFTQYRMPAVDGQRPAVKLSYVLPVPEWDWYVGAGTYVDELEAGAAAVAGRVREQLRASLITIAVLILLFLGLGWLVAHRFAEGLNRELAAFRGFFEQAVEKDARIDPQSLPSAELRDLAVSANRMSGLRVEARQQLARSEHWLRAIIERAPLGIHTYRLEDDGRLIFSGGNPAADRILGIDSSEIEGRTIEDAFPALADTPIPDAYRRLAREGGVWSTGQIDYADERFAGSYEVHAFQVAPGQVATMFEEISERLHAAAQRRDLEDQLRQSQKMEALGQLAGGIAHDFNNLLQAIGGYTSMALVELKDGDDVRADLIQVEQAVDRAAALVRQLLTFSRRQTIQPRAVDLNAIVADISNMLRRLLPESIELSVEAQRPLPHVRADAGQIEQVLMNLCLNARDAMPEGGRLVIGTAAEAADGSPGPSRVALSVEDTGHGMPEAVRQRIFEPFFTTKGPGHGTGLGMAMVYGIVQQHEGEVEIDSEPERGTTVRVRLPVADPATPDGETGPGGPPPGGSETILLAEDEPQVRRLTQDMLERAGYTVLAAVDGDDAIEVFEIERANIDLCLLDVIMPGRGGAEVLAHVRRQAPGMPVLFASGYASDVLSPGLLESADVRLLHKPFESAELLHAVRRALDHGSRPC